MSLPGSGGILPVKLITTMVALVIIAPLLYVRLSKTHPDSFFVRNFIWIFLVLLLLVFLANLRAKGS